MSDLRFQLIASAVKTVVIVVALISVFPFMTWVERRVMGVIQFRWGPNRVGPLGLLQPVADGVKTITKQDIIPADSVKPIYLLSPLMALVPALCAFMVIPFGPTIELLGHPVKLVIADVDAGILIVLAAASLGVYGIVCAGWSSNSKYALIGGLRSSAQMVSYELPLALSAVSVILVSGTLRPLAIVADQAGWFWHWNVFPWVTGGWQTLGFVLFVIAAFAETNRLPFDLPEAESELVAGYHTEYSSLKFAMFFMAEYINMTTSGAVAVTLFLGGYHLGFPPELIGLGEGWLLWILQLAAFVGKVGFFLFLFVWVRWTLPRFRYDQLMGLGWKRLFPLALLNLMGTAVLVALDLVRR
jgi:NADH-quinone oxidoreductase subunit H